jgi:hypothetical protein
MSAKTVGEKEARQVFEQIFRDLNIRKDVRGYEPLMDYISYKYAFPGNKNPMDEIRKRTYNGIKQPADIQKWVKAIKAEEQARAIEEGYNFNVAQCMVSNKAIEEEAKLIERNKTTLLPAMKRCIATAIEHTNQENLSKYSLENLSIILEDGNRISEEWIQNNILHYIGVEYEEYNTYEERVIAYFTDKILEYIKSKNPTL